MDVEDRFVWRRVSQLSDVGDVRIPDDIAVIAKALRYLHDELVRLADQVEDLKDSLSELETDLDLLKGELG